MVLLMIRMEIKDPFLRKVSLAGLVKFSRKSIAEGFSDEVAEIIKEDLWPNPLKYFNNEADEEDFDGDEDDGEKYNEVRRPVYKRRNEIIKSPFPPTSKWLLLPESPFPTALAMDISFIAARLSLADSKPLVRKAEELRRLSDVQFDSSIIDVGEAKAIICLEIAASKFQVLFDRQSAIRMSGMSKNANMRSFNAMQNGLGVKTSIDVRELGIQFGCVKLIPFVQKGLALYREHFLAALPLSRRENTDFNRSVFTAVAFYLCAKRHKLKVDKLKLIELCGTSESEFSTVSTSMNDLCFDVFGISKEMKNPKAVKGHQELLDALPGKRRREDDGDASDDSSVDDQYELELPSYKWRKKMEKQAYEEWKSSVISSNDENKKTAPLKRMKQAQLNFTKKSPNSIALKAS